MSQVSLSVRSPFAIVPLVWLTARKSIMGEHANHPVTTVIAAVIAALNIGLNVLLLRLTGLLDYSALPED